MSTHFTIEAWKARVTRHQPILDGIRRVCLWARQHDALVLTMVLH